MILWSIVGFSIIQALTNSKSKTKAKAGAIREEQCRTGGGENSHIFLTSNEERLLKLMGKKAIEGDIGFPELGNTGEIK